MLKQFIAFANVNGRKVHLGDYTTELAARLAIADYFKEHPRRWNRTAEFFDRKSGMTTYL